MKGVVTVKRFIVLLLIGLVTGAVAAHAVFGGAEDKWRSAQRAANIQSRRARGIYTMSEIQAMETRGMRMQLQRMADAAQTQQMQGANALQRVAALEQTVAGFAQTANGIFDVYDRGFQQVAVDIQALHERILRLEETAGLVTPPATHQGPPARSPHSPD